MTASLPFSPARTVTLLLALLGAALYLDRTERAAKPAAAPVRTLPKDFDAATAWVLTSFHEPNGATRGLFLSYSSDGLRWTELRARDSKPMLVPTIGDRILRDPSLCFRNNRFHLVWTSSWGGTGNASLGFGYTSSADLLTWSAQQFVRVRHERADAINVWAPELLCEAGAPVQVVFASMFEGESLPDSCEAHPQRLFSVHTSDFRTWSPPRELHPAGRHERAALHGGPSTPSYIDAMVLPLGVDDTKELRPKRYLLLYKDERLGVKALRASIGGGPAGPWTPLKSVGEFGKVHCAEGPTAFIASDGMIHVLYDRYRLDDCAHFCKDVTPRYGLLRCKPPENGAFACEEASGRASFTREQRHGGAIALPAPKLRALLATGALVEGSAPGAAAAAPSFYCMSNNCSSADAGTTPGVVAAKPAATRGAKGKRGRDHEGEKGMLMG